MAAEPIPRGHKIALRAIHAGDRVIKYGSPIGTASSEIAAGAHVHTHNVASARGRGDLAATEHTRLAEPEEYWSQPHPSSATNARTAASASAITCSSSRP